jgi:ribosomal protein S15P/S13E
MSNTELLGYQSTFDAEIALALSRFQSKIDNLVNSLVSAISSVPYDPSTATDVFDRSISSFSVGVGDSKSGIYGDFVVDLSNAIEKISQSLNRYIANQLVSSESQLESIRNDISSLSDHISSHSSDAQSKVGNLLSSASSKFSSAILVSQEKSASYYINSLTDSYIGAIKRADEYASESISKLLSIYNTYKTLPAGFYTDANSVLTEISETYNKYITDANTAYNDGLSNYKYYTSSSQSQISTGQSKIGILLEESNKKVSSMFSSLPDMLYNKADFAFASAIAILSSKLFTESIRIRNSLSNLVDDISKKANGTKNILDRYFKTSYSPIYSDTIEYRNSKASISNGAYELLSADLDGFISQYNDKVSALQSNYNTYLNTIQSDVITWINNNVPNLNDEQLSVIETKLSAAISSQNTRVSNYFTIYSNKISSISDGLSAYTEKLLKERYTDVPLLRFTGTNSSPTHISKILSYLDDDDNTIYNNVFTFEVSNVGNVIWYGWFGIRLTCSVDYAEYAADYEEETGDEFTGSYTPPYFIWNKRLGLESLLPGQTKTFKVIVPGNLIYNIDELGDYALPTVVINTVKGDYSSLPA